MTYEEAVKTIPLGRYRHFKGNEYEVIAIARHSETEESIKVHFIRCITFNSRHFGNVMFNQV